MRLKGGQPVFLLVTLFVLLVGGSKVIAERLDRTHSNQTGAQQSNKGTLATRVPKQTDQQEPDKQDALKFDEFPFADILIRESEIVSIQQLQQDLAPMHFSFSKYGIIRNITLQGGSVNWTTITAQDPWVTVEPSSLYIPNGETRELTVYVDRYGFDTGVFQSAVELVRNTGTVDRFEITMDVDSFIWGGTDFKLVNKFAEYNFVMEIAQIPIPFRWKVALRPSWISSFAPPLGTVDPGPYSPVMSGRLTIDPRFHDPGSYFDYLRWTTTLGPYLFPMSASLEGGRSDAHAYNIETLDNLLEKYPCGPRYRYFWEAAPYLVDTTFTFSVHRSSEVNTVEFVVDGERKPPILLSSLSTGTPGQYKWRFTADDNIGSVKQLFSIILELLGAAVNVQGASFILERGELENQGITDIYGTVDSIVLVDKTGVEHTTELLEPEPLRTIHDRTLRWDWVCPQWIGGNDCSINYCSIDVYSTGSPVDMLLTDQAGKQTGMTPTGVVIDIPNSLYSGPDEENEFIIVYDPFPGPRLLKIVGTGVGTYDLLSAYAHDNPPSVSGSFEENIVTSPGKIDEYTKEIPSRDIYLPIVAEQQAPAFSLGFVDGLDCGETTWPVFVMKNTGGMTFESLRKIIYDLDENKGIYGPHYSNQPYKEGMPYGCPLGEESFPPGTFMYSSSRASSWVSGHRAVAYFKNCTKDELQGVCVERSIYFTIP